MSWCAYCGEEGHGVIPLAKNIEGHVKCFVLQNVFEVLNRGKCVLVLSYWAGLCPIGVHAPVHILNSLAVAQLPTGPKSLQNTSV